MNKGTYCLVIKLNKNSWIKAGKNSLCFFTKGYYVYVGSALNNLQKRIARHKSKEKEFHWHIDYFLHSRNTKIVSVKEIISRKRMECNLVKKILGLKKAGIPCSKFGSSDCSCESHLISFPFNPLKKKDFTELFKVK